MFDGAIFYGLCFIPGKFLVWLFTLGKYTTSIVEELSEPFDSWDTKKSSDDDRVFVSYEMVTFIGFLFWVAVLCCIGVGYWTRTFDLVTPLRQWLFNVDQNQS